MGTVLASGAGTQSVIVPFGRPRERRPAAREEALLPAKVQELRRRADAYRRAAAVPTTGGAKTNRILMGLAAQLDRSADTRERQLREVGGDEHQPEP